MSEPTPHLRRSSVDRLPESSKQQAPAMTLRRAMHSREGKDEAEFQIGQGRRAWAVERRDLTHEGTLGRRQAAIVFGTCRSDALRRAQYGGRLGESHHGTNWRVAEIGAAWDEPIEWPLT